MNLEQILQNLTPEQQATAIKYQGIPLEILLPLQFAVLGNDTDTFSFMVMGITENKELTKEYFRTYRDFLNKPEISKLLE